MRLEWIREAQPVDPAEFDYGAESALVRVLLPGQRLVRVEATGQWFIEYAQLIREENDFPLIRQIPRTRCPGKLC